MPTAAQAKPAIDRIYAKTQTDPETGCRIYTPTVSLKPGRAMYIKDGDKTASVLRVVYEHETGKQLSQVTQIRRKCNNKFCVNVDHFKLIG